jgi:hypothetical protein
MRVFIRNAGTGLASIFELVAVKASVFAGFPKQRENSHEDLGGEEQYPEVHAYRKACEAPRTGRLQY